jgi:hypothetical protein
VCYGTAWPRTARRLEEFVALARELASHDPAESSADAVRAERDRH